MADDDRRPSPLAAHSTVRLSLSPTGRPLSLSQREKINDQDFSTRTRVRAFIECNNSSNGQLTSYIPSFWSILWMGCRAVLNATGNMEKSLFSRKFTVPSFVMLGFLHALIMHQKPLTILRTSFGNNLCSRSTRCRGPLSILLTSLLKHAEKRVTTHLDRGRPWL